MTWRAVFARPYLTQRITALADKIVCDEAGRVLSSTGVAEVRVGSGIYCSPRHRHAF